MKKLWSWKTSSFEGKKWRYNRRFSYTPHHPVGKFGLMIVFCSVFPWFFSAGESPLVNGLCLSVGAVGALMLIVGALLPGKK